MEIISILVIAVFLLALYVIKCRNSNNNPSPQLNKNDPVSNFFLQPPQPDADDVVWSPSELFIDSNNDTDITSVLHLILDHAPTIHIKAGLVKTLAEKMMPPILSGSLKPGPILQYDFIHPSNFSKSDVPQQQQVEDYPLRLRLLVFSIIQAIVFTELESAKVRKVNTQPFSSTQNTLQLRSFFIQLIKLIASQLGTAINTGLVEREIVNIFITPFFSTFSWCKEVHTSEEILLFSYFEGLFLSTLSEHSELTIFSTSWRLFLPVLSRMYNINKYKFGYHHNSDPVTDYQSATIPPPNAKKNTHSVFKNQPRQYAPMDIISPVHLVNAIFQPNVPFRRPLPAVVNDVFASLPSLGLEFADIDICSSSSIGGDDLIRPLSQYVDRDAMFKSLDQELAFYRKTLGTTLKTPFTLYHYVIMNITYNPIDAFRILGLIWELCDHFIVDPNRNWTASEMTALFFYPIYASRDVPTIKLMFLYFSYPWLWRGEVQRNVRPTSNTVHEGLRKRHKGYTYFFGHNFFPNPKPAGIITLHNKPLHFCYDWESITSSDCDLFFLSFLLCDYTISRSILLFLQKNYQNSYWFPTTSFADISSIVTRFEKSNRLKLGVVDDPHYFGYWAPIFRKPLMITSQMETLAKDFIPIDANGQIDSGLFQLNFEAATLYLGCSPDMSRGDFSEFFRLSTMNILHMLWHRCAPTHAVDALAGIPGTTFYLPPGHNFMESFSNSQPIFARTLADDSTRAWKPEFKQVSWLSPKQQSKTNVKSAPKVELQRSVEPEPKIEFDRSVKPEPNVEIEVAQQVESGNRDWNTLLQAMKPQLQPLSDNVESQHHEPQVIDGESQLKSKVTGIESQSTLEGSEVGSSLAESEGELQLKDDASDGESQLKPEISNRESQFPPEVPEVSQTRSQLQDFGNIDSAQTVFRSINHTEPDFRETWTRRTVFRPIGTKPIAEKQGQRVAGPDELD